MPPMMSTEKFSSLAAGSEVRANWPLVGQGGQGQLAQRHRLAAHDHVHAQHIRVFGGAEVDGEGRLIGGGAFRHGMHADRQNAGRAVVADVAPQGEAAAGHQLVQGVGQAEGLQRLRGHLLEDHLKQHVHQLGRQLEAGAALGGLGLDAQHGQEARQAHQIHLRDLHARERGQAALGHLRQGREHLPVAADGNLAGLGHIHRDRAAQAVQVQNQGSADELRLAAEQRRAVLRDVQQYGGHPGIRGQCAVLAQLGLLAHQAHREGHFQARQVNGLGLAVLSHADHGVGVGHHRRGLCEGGGRRQQHQHKHDRKQLFHRFILHMRCMYTTAPSLPTAPPCAIIGSNPGGTCPCAGARRAPRARLRHRKGGVCVAIHEDAWYR